MTLNSHEKPRFTGRVTASISHEIQNVLAIIKERAGLMEDLLAMGRDMSADALAGRLGTSLSTIKTQVQRGVRLTSGLNAFAHTSDHDRIQIDVRDMVDRLIFLTERLTRGKEIKFHALECPKAPGLQTDPVIFQLAVHRSMECLYRVAPQGSSIAISFSEQPGEIQIKLALENNVIDTGALDEDVTASADWESLLAACEAIHGKASVLRDLPGICLAFTRQSSL
ncbi:MAG: hypothetical protein V1793_03010 [Pseudomonadota bacterium]